MRALPLSLFMLTSLLSFNSHAAEPFVEPQAMLYYQIPFGGSDHRQYKHTFGFRMDLTHTGSGQLIAYQQLLKKPAVFDLKMGHDGIDALYISGVDYLQHYYVHRANDEDTAATETAYEGDAAAAEEATAEEAATEEEPAGPTIGEILRKTPFGIIIGAGLLIGIVAGAGG
ncbi:MAG: hypothetical protein ACE5GZ_12940 [Gammaproteobacteria bacterium]